MRIKKVRSICFCSFFYLGLPVLVPTAHCQTEVTLRFLDAQSSKPITGIAVAVFAWDENRGKQKPSAPAVLKVDKKSQVIKTDKEGKARLLLDDDPKLRTLYVEAGSDLRGCSAHEFPMEEVLKTGVVANYYAGRPKWCVALKAQATAKPGEIVIFDKRMTVLDRMRQEIP